MLKNSIIISTYKVEAYIERCLKSVLDQTDESGAYSIECIFVDDSTPDHSMEIRFSASKRISHYQLQKI